MKLSLLPRKKKLHARHPDWPGYALCGVSHFQGLPDFVDAGQPPTCFGCLTRLKKKGPLT